MVRGQLCRRVEGGLLTSRCSRRSRDQVDYRPAESGWAQGVVRLRLAIHDSIEGSDGILVDSE